MLEYQERLAALISIQDEIHKTAHKKGWWDKDRTFAECIALVHSELSEALEAKRDGDKIDEHCHRFNNAEVELGDAIIRILDLAAHGGMDVPRAMLAKMEYNETREYRHGKEF